LFIYFQPDSSFTPLADLPGSTAVVVLHTLWLLPAVLLTFTSTSLYVGWICALCTLRFSVENAYLEEKEDTCNALGEIAENVGYVYTAQASHKVLHTPVMIVSCERREESSTGFW